MRSQRQVPNLYFGQPGRLVTLPYPLGGVDRTTERQTYDFLTGSGLHQVSQLVETSRNYQISWNALHQDTFTLLEQFRIGANGPGPFVYIDPSAPNCLPANAAAATGLTSDATDFLTLTNGGTVSSNNDPAFIHRPTGYRSIKWTFPENLGVLIANPVLSIRSPYRNWSGIPLRTGLGYTWSSWMRMDGIIDSAATAVMQMEWFDSLGASLGTAVSLPISLTASWIRASVNLFAPTNAAFVVPKWSVTGSTITQNASIYIDEPLLEQDIVVNDWAPGTGVRPVQILGLTEAVPFEARFRTGVQMTLRELTR